MACALLERPKHCQGIVEMVEFVRDVMIAVAVLVTLLAVFAR